MKALALKDTLATINIWDLQLCVAVNRSCRLVPIQRFFTAVSKMGDGLFWYVWMAILPLLYGVTGAVATLQMIASGLVGLYFYRSVKGLTHRLRPFDASREIFRGAAPLDKFSFPSGHTLHAVCFTTLLVTHYPITAWVLVPFAGLVALSRLVLGLHYPSDVFIGGLCGFTLARMTLFLTSLI